MFKRKFKLRTKAKPSGVLKAQHCSYFLFPLFWKDVRFYDEEFDVIKSLVVLPKDESLIFNAIKSEPHLHLFEARQFLRMWDNRVAKIELNEKA